MMSESRLPDPMPLFPDLVNLGATMVKATQGGPVPQPTLGLVQLRAGQLAGSTYHTIGITTRLREAGESAERITAVASWPDAPYFTDAEKAALELVEAILGPAPAGPRVGDELFARLCAHYDDKAVWTLTLAISQICYFIPIALVARPVPGMPPGQNYTR